MKKEKIKDYQGDFTSLREHIKSELADCIGHNDTLEKAFEVFITKLLKMKLEGTIQNYRLRDVENGVIEIQPYFSPLPVWEVRFAPHPPSIHVPVSMKGCADPEAHAHWLYIDVVSGEHGEGEQTERCLMCDMELYKRSARDMEQAVDNVRRALRLESTHYFVIHNEVEDVIEERDALRSALDKAHHWLMNLIQTNDKKQHERVMAARPDGADLGSFYELISHGVMSSNVKCPVCGNKRPIGTPACPNCGNVSLEACDRCGGEGETVLGCPLCGKIKLKRKPGMPTSFEKRKLEIKELEDGKCCKDCGRSSRRSGSDHLCYCLKKRTMVWKDSTCDDWESQVDF